MRRFAVVALLLFVSCITVSSPSPIVDSRLIRGALERNVVVYDEGRMICSGFILETNVVLTAGHCGEGSKKITVNKKPAKILKRSSNPDLAQLQAETADFPKLQMRNPHWREKIFSMGNKGLQKNVWSLGRVLFKLPHSTYANTLAYPGYSGSCIYSMREELLGVHVESMYVSNFSISVPGGDVQKFIQKRPGE